MWTVNECYTSLENPIEFNQSDDNFETPDILPILCAKHQAFSQQPTGVCLRLGLGAL